MLLWNLGYIDQNVKSSCALHQSQLILTQIKEGNKLTSDMKIEITFIELLYCPQYIFT